MAEIIVRSKAHSDSIIFLIISFLIIRSQTLRNRIVGWKINNLGFLDRKQSPSNTITFGLGDVGSICTFR